MVYDGSRFNSNKPVTCTICGKLDDWFVLYEDGNNVYCSTCALTHGAIDHDQWIEDCYENDELALTYHEGKVEYYREKVKNG